MWLLYLYLKRNIKCQYSCRYFLEVRKLLKLQGVAYLEGRFKSRSYGTIIPNAYDICIISHL